MLLNLYSPVASKGRLRGDLYRSEEYIECLCTNERKWTVSLKAKFWKFERNQREAAGKRSCRPCVGRYVMQMSERWGLSCAEAITLGVGKISKVIPLQARCGPEGG